MMINGHWHLKATWVWIGFALMGVQAASASLVTIVFSGELDYVEAGLPFSNEIGPGTEFHGTFTYDTSVLDNAPNNSSVGGYSFPTDSMLVNIGSVDFETPDLAIGITNNALIDIYSAGNISDFNANNVEWRSMAISLRDATAAAFSSDVLPLGPPNLAEFDFARTFSLVQVNRHDASITGEITSITHAPEPSALSLFAAGALLALRGVTRRRS